MGSSQIAKSKLPVAGEGSAREPDAAAVSPKTITFLFADVEGSTGLLQRLSSDDYRSVLAKYHRILNEVTIAHDGRVVRTDGDGFFCVFGSPPNAAEAAFRAQLAMAAEKWPAGEHPRCRIGLHSGTATLTAEGYVGLDVHIAARIGAAAQGGQILLSNAMAGLIAEQAESAGWVMVDLGEFDLAGILRTVRLLRMDVPGHDVVAIPPRARRHSPSVVPVPPHPIVGRLDEIGAVTTFLRSDATRLVTLTGPGGTGKTRLALEVARRVEEDFPDGIVFIDLSAVHDRSRFLPLVGRALGVRESKDLSIPKALHSVLGVSRMLLVLDNVEQIPAAAVDIAAIVAALPGVKLLVTSRAPLAISWEREFPVQPLTLPEEDADLDEVAASEAVVLFMERTLAIRPSFRLDASTRKVVVDIVRKLDGLPLAIELATARLRVFTVEELCERLDDRLGILDRGSLDAPERHQTLRAAIRWSYDLLRHDDQVVFRRLSVFSGGWALDGALAVCRADDFSDPRLVDILENLVARSLVVFTVDDWGRPRYRLLETLREFAEAELRDSGEEPGIRLRHLRWCRELAERMKAVLPTPAFPGYLDELERERFNIREALAWSSSVQLGLDDALTICGMLALFWDTRGFVPEGLHWSRTLADMTTTEGQTLPRAMTHAAMGWLEILSGDPEKSRWAFAVAEQMLRDLGEDEWLARTLAMAGMASYNRNDPDTAERELLEAIELSANYDLDWLVAGWCEYGLAHVALLRGDFAGAVEGLVKVLEFSRRHDLTWAIGYSQLSLAVVAFMAGDIEQSFERTIESLQLRTELRDARGICDCLGMMATLAEARAQHRLAATLLGAAELARQAAGYTEVPRLQELLDQTADNARDALGDDFDSLHGEGLSLTVDEALDLAVANSTIDMLDLPVSRGQAPTPPH